ncbi:MAG: (Na+)-NQR maturation NqrM [Pseudomonadales bacterium]
MEFFLAFLFLLTIVSAMAIGVISGRKPISGSCGGLSNLGIAGACEICGGDLAKCEKRDASVSASRSPPAGTPPAGNFYDAA